LVFAAGTFVNVTAGPAAPTATPIAAAPTPTAAAAASTARVRTCIDPSSRLHALRAPALSRRTGTTQGGARSEVG
jgi:hypothetical protein